MLPNGATTKAKTNNNFCLSEYFSYDYGFNNYLKIRKNSKNLILTQQKLYKQLIINRTTIIKTGIKFLITVYYAIIFIIYLQIIMFL